MHIGFVNFNTDEKKRVAKMMQTLKEQEAVEELGIGRVRDHFSNTLFPGTSTLQHHAKYFVVLPWIYYNAITGKKLESRKEVDEYIRKQEIKFTRCLLKADEREGGITGKEKIAAAEKDYTRFVKYNPTYIYSSGMHKYGIVSDANIEKLILWRNDVHHQELTEDNEEKMEHSKYIKTCGEDYDLSGDNKLSLALTQNEAEFLKGKIMALPGDPMLKKLIESGQDMPKNYFEAGKLIESHQEIFTIYRRSVLFSMLIHLLDWRYNHAYYKSFDKVDKADTCAKEYTELKDKYMEQGLKNVQEYANLFEYTKAVDSKLTDFCEDCYKAMLEDDTQRIDKLIIERERKVKEKRSKIGNSAYKDKDRGKPLPITYRWLTVSTIVTEITNPQPKE